MAFTKLVARHDRIEIDGTDVSNAFKEFRFSSEDSDEDVSGFSATGVDESLPGTRAQGFSGTAYYTEESAALIAPLHFNRTVVEILWQPNGLVDGSATTYYANCTINTFGPENTRGSVSTMPFAAKTADEDGIQYGAGT